MFRYAQNVRVVLNLFLFWGRRRGPLNTAHGWTQSSWRSLPTWPFCKFCKIMSFGTTATTGEADGCNYCSSFWRRRRKGCLQKQEDESTVVCLLVEGLEWDRSLCGRTFSRCSFPHLHPLVFAPPCPWQPRCVWALL